MGITKTEGFTQKQNELSVMAKALGHPARIAIIRQQFPTMLAVEMEGAAIAQVCHMLHTPFVVIRSLSDIAGKESPQSFEAYLEVASKNSSAMVAELISSLAGVSL